MYCILTLCCIGIAFSDDMLKAELFELIRMHTSNQPKQCVCDEWAKEMGHEVLRLPPYHCELNPIELIWGIMKVS